MGSYWEGKEGGQQTLLRYSVWGCSRLSFLVCGEMRKDLVHLTRKLIEIRNYGEEKKQSTLLMHNGSCSFSLEVLRSVRKDTDCFLMTILLKFMYVILLKVSNFFFCIVRDYNCKRLSLNAWFEWRDEETFNTGIIWAVMTIHVLCLHMQTYFWQIFTLIWKTFCIENCMIWIHEKCNTQK